MTTFIEHLKRMNRKERYYRVRGPPDSDCVLPSAGSSNWLSTYRCLRRWIVTLTGSMRPGQTA